MHDDYIGRNNSLYLNSQIVLKGSFTIEAALIFPMVVFVVIFIVYSAFYMHNEAVICGAVYETAIYGSTLDKTDVNVMQKKMLEKYNQSIGHRLISMDNPQVKIEVNGKDVKVKIRGVMKTASIGFIPDYNGFAITAEKIVSYSNPIDKIRVLKTMKK